MPSCAAYGCTERFDRKRYDGITFHGFPSDPILRARWIAATRRENFNPSKYAKLCSKHFREDDLDRTSLCYVRVREGAVPSVFDAFPVYLQQIPKTRKPPTVRLPPGEPLEMPLNRLPESDEHLGQGSSLPSSEESPRKMALKRKLEQTQTLLTNSRKKIKVLQQSKRRLLKKNAHLESVITDLRRHDLLSTESLTVLEQCGGGIGDLLKKQICKKSGQSVSSNFSAALRSFALTLHFYSPHAYNYVRKMFDTCLPHPRTIAKWFQSIDGSPGLTADSFSALKSRASFLLAAGKQLVCSLLIDEVAIRQQVEWDGKQFAGYIDLGTGLDDDSRPLAKEALTFMAVGINDSFKIPVGYFLISGLGGLERANLVKDCLEKLHNAGACIASLTFDGCASNLAMVKHLGCNLSVDTVDYKSYFLCAMKFSQDHLELFFGENSAPWWM